MVGTVWYTLALPGVSEPGRPRSFAGRLRTGVPKGALLAGQQLAAELVAPRFAALSAGPLERGVWPLRPSRAAPDKHRRFDRGAHVLLLEWPNRTEGGRMTEITTPVMVKRSDCSDRTVVTRQRSRCLGHDGSGRPRCELGRVAGPRNAWGYFAPVIRPKHGVGRMMFLVGRSVRDSPMSAGIAPSYLAAAENAGRSLTLGCGQRRRGCCFRRRAQTSRSLGFSVRLWEASRTTLPASSLERASVALRRICLLRP
ncbi:unnamed protein product [Prunus armeniaca]